VIRVAGREVIRCLKLIQILSEVTTNPSIKTEAAAAFTAYSQAIVDWGLTQFVQRQAKPFTQVEMVTVQP